MASDGNLPPGAGALLKNYWRLALWVIERPFLARPGVWYVATGLLAVGLAASFIWDVSPSLVQLAALALEGLLLAATVSWWLLRRPSKKYLVFLARFSAETALGIDAAITQQDALLQRLAQQPLLADLEEVRKLKGTPNERQGRMLLEHSRADAVVFGEIRAIAEYAHLQAAVFIRSSWSDAMAGYTNELERHASRKQPVEREAHKLPDDPEYPLPKLTARRLEADHADGVEATLLVVAADRLLAEVADRLAPGKPPDAELHARAASCIEAADAMRDKLSTGGRAALEINRMLLALRPQADLQPPLLALEKAGQRDAGHADLWRTCSHWAFISGLAGRPLGELRLRAEQRAVALAPDSLEDRFNLANALREVGQKEEARREYECVLQSENPRLRALAHRGLGVIDYEARRVEEAHARFQTSLALRGDIRTREYLAHSEYRIGDYAKARAGFRKALRQNPENMDAFLGYHASYQEEFGDHPRDSRRLAWISWLGAFPWPAINRLFRTPMWWLLRAYWRRHPEDLAIRWKLARTAVLRQRFDTARVFIKVAQHHFQDPSEAMALLATCEGLEGHVGQAKKLLKDLRHPHGQYPSDITDPNDKAKLLIQPFEQEPRLMKTKNADAYLGLIYHRFGDSLPPRDKVGARTLERTGR